MVHASNKRPAPSTVSVRRLLFCVAAAGSASLEGDPTVWLTYYASDEEREEWRLEEGRAPPPRQVQPRALPVADA